MTRRKSESEASTFYWHMWSVPFGLLRLQRLSFSRKLLDQLPHLSGWAISHARSLLYSTALLYYRISIDTTLRYLFWMFVPLCWWLPHFILPSSSCPACHRAGPSLGFQCWLIARGMSRSQMWCSWQIQVSQTEWGWAMPQLSDKLWFSISGLPQ